MTRDDVPEGMVAMESGIIVPEAAAAKPVKLIRRTMLQDTFKRILRFVRFARAEGIVMAFACPECKHTIDVTIEEQEAPLKPLTVLRCQCTVWMVR